MRNTISAVILGATVCALPLHAVAQTSSSALPAKPPPSQDTRLVPIHSQICDGQIVNKHKLFVQMAENASPPVSIKLLTSVDWRRIVTEANVCAKSKACEAKDDAAIVSMKQEYSLFLGFSDSYYRASNPNLSVEQYFQGGDGVNPIYCTGKGPSTPIVASSPLDVKSQIRIRGVSDDLWISQQNQALFAKASSATVNFTANEAVPKTQTTAIVGAVGYDLLADQSALGSLVPYVAANISSTDTHLKPRTNAPTNFVAGGILYNANLYTTDLEHQIILKAQQVDGTTMRSELTSLQAIYAPWTNPMFPLPALNSVVGFPTPEGTVPSYFGQVLFDVRADLGYYEDRGLPPFIAQNQNYARFGSKFGYSFIANPTSYFPAFSFTVAETALYGATGGPRNLSYFDTLLQIYFDPKKYFSATLEYTNGRNENTYVLTRDYKAGLSAHY